MAATTALQFRDIGRGTCGSVFAIPHTVPALAIKKGSNTVAIWNDFNLTNAAYDSALTWHALLELEFPGRRVPLVPQTCDFHGPDAAEFWTAATLERFPEADRTRGAAFHMEHIPPVAETFRERLVREFYASDESVQRHVLRKAENLDCLVRLYFGGDTSTSQTPSLSLSPLPRYGSDDTLRNFPLSLDGAREKMGLDVHAYAEEMALGLVVLHWAAGIDGQDTEFVLGAGGGAPPATTTPSEMRLWMLDFDKCARFPDLRAKARHGPDEVARRYLVAVTGNDPYFPHPRRGDELWAVFRRAYLRASGVVIAATALGSHCARLPGLLIAHWERWAERDVQAEQDFFERDAGDSDDNDDADGWGDDDDDHESGTDSESGEDVETRT
jgi:hypothetical protein